MNVKNEKNWYSLALDNFVDQPRPSPGAPTAMGRRPSPRAMLLRAVCPVPQLPEDVQLVDYLHAL